MKRSAWLGRARTAEALLALGIAQMLVGAVPLRWWRARMLSPSDRRPPAPEAIRHCAAAIDRAEARISHEFRCLPRALAMRMLLRRRGYEVVLVIGTRAPSKRRGTDDLHAWLESNGVKIFGDREEEDIGLFYR